jgi:putative transposase
MIPAVAAAGWSLTWPEIRNLMRRLGLQTIYQKPRTTVQDNPSVRFPCLVNLRGITAVGQAWATDTTYVRLQKDYPYLVAIVDLFSRDVYSVGKALG